MKHLKEEEERKIIIGMLGGKIKGIDRFLGWAGYFVCCFVVIVNFAICCARSSLTHWTADDVLSLMNSEMKWITKHAITGSIAITHNDPIFGKAKLWRIVEFAAPLSNPGWIRNSDRSKQTCAIGKNVRIHFVQKRRVDSRARVRYIQSSLLLV